MSVKYFARNSRVGNGCADLCAPGICWLSLQEKLHAHKIPRFRGGGGVLWALGGRGAPILF